MNKERELINISYFDNQELSIKEHYDMYRKIVMEITNILRKYDIKFVLAETEVCKDLKHQLEEKDKIIDEAINYIKNIKNYVYDVKRDVTTGKLIANDKMETNTINKTKLLEILERGKNANSK